MKRLLPLVGAALLAAVSVNAFHEDDGWRVALQAWTLRSSTFFETVDQARALGLRYLEAYPGQPIGGGLEGTTHFAMDEATRDKLKAKLNEAGVTLVQYGVVHGKDEAEWRQIFAFAQAMGIETITSEPPKEQLDLVARLADEYGVDVGIHNHPKPSRYWNPNTVLEVLEGRGPRLGVCADTGHYVRSGLDPVAVLNKVGSRVKTVHIKDLAQRDPKARDAVYGTGAGDIHGQLLALRNSGFRGVITIEYEHESPALLDEVAGCVAYLQDWDGSNAALRTAMTNDVRAVWASPREGSAPAWTMRDILPPVPPAPEVPISELPLVRVQAGPEGMKDGTKSNGEPLSFQGKTTDQGLGIHGDSELCYNVPEQQQGFVASATVDAGSMIFKVYGANDADSEGRLLEQSPPLPVDGIGYWNFDLNLRGRYPMIRLVTEAAGDDKAAARGSWINPGFMTKE
jgi:sugar phosphate isomerase/epimerase